MVQSNSDGNGGEVSYEKSLELRESCAVIFCTDL